ncbi:hypothetical protein [Cellulosimicrobium sp. CUA-896]|uniref:hypothetical protein n=1 Tax=Cellulosimicrobium sp. CUA-896 TaxID=1517881 RepID=UPI00095CDE81|nr:hypothetical protein [Cellulosimicrobium sp. CUA-896]OLT55119.1 hypothetical protein BJF88_07690 [Cellulosimicrobium sp. CUA-896]
MTAVVGLALAELRETATVWTGVGAVAATAGGAAGLVASLVVTAGDVRGTAALALYGISGTALAFTAVAVVVTVASVTELTLALLRGRFALWALAGVTPGGVTTAALVQLVVVTTAGASAGAALAAVTAPRLVGASLAGTPLLADVDVRLGLPATAVVTAVVVVLAAAAGLRPARRAGRPARAEPPGRRTRARDTVGAGRLAVAALASVALASVVTSARSADDPGTPLLLVAPLAAAVLIAVGPLFVAPSVHRWTRVVATEPPPAWFLARAQRPSC